jgi:hypothetical protein
MEQLLNRPEFQSAVVPFIVAFLCYLGTLTITSMNCGLHPFANKDACGFDASGSIRRSDFGVSYGLPGIGDALDLNVELDAIKS